MTNFRIKKLESLKGIGYSPIHSTLLPELKRLNKSEIVCLIIMNYLHDFKDQNFSYYNIGNAFDIKYDTIKAGFEGLQEKNIITIEDDLVALNSKYFNEKNLVKKKIIDSIMNNTKNSIGDRLEGLNKEMGEALKNGDTELALKINDEILLLSKSIKKDKTSEHDSNDVSNTNLENNFNNTKTEDYVTTIRTDSNTINTSNNSNDNHISSNEEKTEEDLSFQDGEDGFGEDRIDDIQEDEEVIEDTSNDINKYKNLNLELLDYHIPNYEDTSNDNEVDNKEEVKTNEMITQETVDLFNELLLLTEGTDLNSKKENIRIKISDWKRRNEKNYSSNYYRDIALNQFLKEEIANYKIYDTVPDVEEVKVIEDYSYEETKIRNSNDSYAEALKILINRYSNDNLNEEEITKEYNSFFGTFYEKKSLNDVLFVYEQVKSKYNKQAA